MAEELSAEASTRIYARGGVTGVCWGTRIGLAFLVVLAVPGSDSHLDLSALPLLLFAGGIAALAGAIVGGVAGTVNGMILALREDSTRRSDLDHRVTAFVTTTALLGGSAFALTGGHPGLAGAVVTFTGSAAGALLAPSVVHGKRRHRRGGSR